MLKFLRYICYGIYGHITEYGWRSFVVYANGCIREASPVGLSGHRRFVADPFLFYYNGANWLFYETVDEKDKGKIGCFREEGDRWIYQGIVLERPWHLSYPQVFEEGGHVYMIPEQSDVGNGTVAIYEAMSFPNEWKLKKVLIDRPFADSTLLKRDGHYYMACYTIPPNETAELWHSPKLLGPWERHPMWNRINQSNRLRRCGGRFIERDGRLYRIAQDCNGAYGKRLFKVPVLRLTPDEYEEGRAEIFLDKTTWPHQYKHTYNEITTSAGARIAVFDAQGNILMPIGRAVLSLMRRAFGR